MPIHQSVHPLRANFEATAPWLLAALLAALPASGVLAQPPEPPSSDPELLTADALLPRDRYRVSPATSPVRVDGALEEAAWTDAVVVPIPWEWFPGDNTAAPVETDVLVTFDDTHLFVAFRARDPQPEAIRAHLADRDTERQDDVVGIEIDTFNDRRRAYRFQVNPLGVQLDARISDADDRVDLSWDAIWDSAGQRTSTGYQVEMAIPFHQLRFPRHAAGAVQTWGFLAYREYPRSVLHQLRSTPNRRDLDCRVCQYETVTGLTGMDTGHNVELIPTVTADRTDRRRAPTEPLEEGSEDIEGGLTARWGITDSVTLHATVNPDFSQVEADVAQLAVNERFALFFPERRPFFLEGADFFATPLNAVFTRTVADPAWGAKVTGKEGPHAFGVFAAHDEINNLILPGADSSGFAFLDRKVTSGVVRYRRDVGATSSLGLLYAGREGEGSYHNHVVGIDGNLRLTASDTLRFQVLESDTRYPGSVVEGNGQPAGDFRGTALRLDYTRGTREWALRALYQSYDDGFRADSGFIPRVGYRQAVAIAQRIFWGQPEDWYRRLEVVVNGTRLETQKGELVEQGGNLELVYRGALQSEVRLGIRPNEETFRGRSFENLRADLQLSLRPSGAFAGELFVRGGEIIDFTNVRQADFLVLRPRVEFRLGRHFTGDLQHEWQELEHRGQRYLTANLTQTTLLYHLNVRAFFRAILQYQDVERVLAVYRPGTNLPSNSEELFTQLLFSYKLNARTVLFAGYSDTALGADAVDLTRTDRTFFFKLGYALLW